MGKLKDLIQEYLRTPKGSPREEEIASEIKNISDWMIDNGYTNKAVQLPKKRNYRRTQSFEPIGPPVGEPPWCPFCLHSAKDLNTNHCNNCDMGASVLLANWIEPRPWNNSGKTYRELFG